MMAKVSHFPRCSSLRVAGLVLLWGLVFPLLSACGGRLQLVRHSGERSYVATYRPRAYYSPVGDQTLIVVRFRDRGSLFLTDTARGYTLVVLSAREYGRGGEEPFFACCLSGGYPVTYAVLSPGDWRGVDLSGKRPAVSGTLSGTPVRVDWLNGRVATGDAPGYYRSFVLKDLSLTPVNRDQIRSLLVSGYEWSSSFWARELPAELWKWLQTSDAMAP